MSRLKGKQFEVESKNYTPGEFSGSVLTIPVNRVRASIVFYKGKFTIPQISFDDQDNPTQIIIDMIEIPDSNVRVILI